MEIKTPQEITGEMAAEIRKQEGKKQKEFWNDLGMTQSGGCRCEAGLRIPMPVRHLIFVKYVVGLPFDLSNPDGIERLRRVANVAASELAPKKEEIGAAISSAMKSIKSASRSLASVSGVAEEHF